MTYNLTKSDTPPQVFISGFFWGQLDQWDGFYTAASTAF